MSERRDERRTRTLECDGEAEIVIRARAGRVTIVVEGDSELVVRSGRAVERLESESTSPPRDQRLDKALALVRDNPTRRFTVPLLAKAAGASRSTIARLFQEHLGQTPNAWLTAQRLELARTLLTRTRSGLADIAARTGYASEFALSRAFKRRFGVAPGVFRRSAARGLAIRVAA